MSNAAIYARVSSARQKEQETIGSQVAALHAHAERLGLDVPQQWVFCDDGHSGATLVRPALERLRDLVAQVPVDTVLVYSPDRLARKYAYQALLRGVRQDWQRRDVRQGAPLGHPGGRPAGAVPGHDRRV
jgi:site-specific DNA recombinase